MIRRSHKKSRQGCTQCKRAHKKCDETKPSCIACTSTQKSCSYTPSTDPQEPNFMFYDGDVEFGNPLLATLSTYTANSSPQPELMLVAPPREEPYVNFLHLELFENVTSNAFALFDVDPQGKRGEWMATMFKYTFKYKYLMYEILALSAFHLSTQSPEKASIYLAESATLQTKALSLFNSSNPTADEENILPAFLFSGAIGLHFFCETFTHPTPSLNDFLTRLTQSINLLRGVRALIGTSWAQIRTSEISPVLSPESPHPTPRINANTIAFTYLIHLLSTSHTLSAYESKIYCDAVSDLIWVCNSNAVDVVENGILYSRMVTTWPIRLSAEFVAFLEEKRPEALVVMGYFAVLLWEVREFWAVEEAGRVLLTKVEEALGEEWGEWLAVPKRIVFAEDMGEGIV